MNSHTTQFYMGLMARIRQLLESDEFKQRHRTSVKAFCRERILTFTLTILFLLNMVKHATQDELDEFFKVLHNDKVAADCQQECLHSSAGQTQVPSLHRTQ